MRRWCPRSVSAPSTCSDLRKALPPHEECLWRTFSFYLLTLQDLWELKIRTQKCQQSKVRRANVWLLCQTGSQRVLDSSSGQWSQVFVVGGEGQELGWRPSFLQIRKRWWSEKHLSIGSGCETPQPLVWCWEVSEVWWVLFQVPLSLSQYPRKQKQKIITPCPLTLDVDVGLFSAGEVLEFMYVSFILGPSGHTSPFSSLESHPFV